MDSYREELFKRIAVREFIKNRQNSQIDPS